jgi:hypothetical protein
MNASSAPDARPPITDNPWFWLYLFGTAGLVGVMLLGTKFEARQQGFDANFTRRQQLLEQRATGQIATEADEPRRENEPRYIHFYWLYGIVALGTGAAWVMLWRQHFHPRATPATNRTETESST